MFQLLDKELYELWSQFVFLKKQKCDLCFIHFIGVAEWYAKLGYETFLKEYFGIKKLKMQAREKDL